MNSARLKYRIFDAHTHAFPDAIAARAVQSLSQKADIPYYHDGSLSGLREYEKNGGAFGYLILPIATKPSQTRSINEWAAGAAGGGVCAFGSVHPQCADVEAELDYALGLGLKGIKLHPEYQEFFVDDEGVFPLYEGIFSRGMILYLHAGEDLGFEPPVHGAVERIARLCDAFPGGKIVAAHMGGFMQWDEAIETLCGRKNLWMDTSFACERMEREQIVRLIRAHGAGRVLFGTDAPWSDFDVSADAVLNSGLQPWELEHIFYQNAEELFNQRDAGPTRSAHML